MIFMSCWFTLPSSSMTSFGLKSTLSEMSMDTPAFLLCPCAWYVFSHLFTFSLWVSLSMRWVSCRQQIVGFFFLIQYANLCLLIDECRPLTFRVIIVIWFVFPVIWFIFVFWHDLVSPLFGYSFRLVPRVADLHICFSSLPHGIFCWECSVMPAFFL